MYFIKYARTVMIAAMKYRIYTVK